MDEVKQELSLLSQELHNWSTANESARKEWCEKGLMGFIATLNPHHEAVLAAERSYLSQTDTALAPSSERPVFILGCAGRCGSTLLQRALSSLPDLFIWGENSAITERLMELNGSDESAAAWYTAYYKREMGSARWGFKEIRHDARPAEYLGRLFPEARFLVLVRDPVDALASLAGCPWYAESHKARGYTRSWLRNAPSLVAWNDPRRLLIRYEDLVADPSKVMEGVARHLGVGPEFDLGLFDKKVGGTSSSRFGPREYLALHRTDLIRVAAEIGYDIPAHPRMKSYAWLERFRW